MGWLPASGRGRAVAGLVLILVAVGAAALLRVVLDEDPPDGPLVSRGGESVSLFAPKGQERWSGTFGLILCTRKSAEIEVTSVDYRYRVEPRSAESAVRRAGGSPGVGGPAGAEPVASYRGTAAQLEQDYPAGTLEPATGATFGTACPDATDAAFTQLLTTMEVDGRGGWIDRVTIHYTSDGQAHELSDNVNYVACGTAVLDTDWCALD